MKKNITLTVFLAFLFGSAFCQNDLPNFIASDYRSLELKIGNGKLQPQLLNANVLYQRNVAKHLALVSYSEFDFSVFGTNPQKNYLVTNYFHWVETIGLGATVGKGRLNNGLYLLAGGRFYRSKSYVDEALKSTLLTQKVLPELSLLYNLKLGKKKCYFSAQVYVPFYPFQMFKNNETNITVSLGVGYKFHQK